MDSHIQFFDELPRRDNVKFIFTGRDDTFLIYVFFRNDEINPLDVLSENNLMASKSGLSDFWMKKSIHSYDSKIFENVYVLRAIDIEGNNVKFC